MSTTGDPAALVRRTVDEANDEAYSLRLTNPREGVKLAESARTLASQASYLKGEADAWKVSGACHCLMQEHEEALAHLYAALEIYERLDDPAGRARTLGWAGFVEYNRGDFPAALAAETAALDLQRAVRDEEGEAATLNFIGLTLLAIDDYAGALNAYTDSWRIVRNTGDLIGISHCLNNIGGVLFELGEWEQASRRFRQALYFKQKARDRVNYAGTLANLGKSEERLGRPERAMEYFRRAESAARRWGTPQSLALAMQSLGFGEIAGGRVERGLEMHREALGFARGASARYWEAECLVDYGKALRLAGRPAEAVAVLRDALAIAESLRAARIVAEVHEELAAACAASGDEASALAHAQRFREVKRENDELHRRSRAAVLRAESHVTERDVRRLRGPAKGGGRAPRDSRLRHYEQLISAYERISQEDFLTGLFNRRHFEAQLARQFARAKRHRKALTLAMSDVDRFKQVNDRFGHAVGDQVLSAVGRVFRDAVRQMDVAGRYGGEEIALLLVDTPPADAAGICERLRAAVEGYDWASIHPDLRVTVSFGLSGDLSVGSPQALLAAADARLYEAKRAGRNRVRGVP